MDPPLRYVSQIFQLHELQRLVDDAGLPGLELAGPGDTGAPAKRDGGISRRPENDQYVVVLKIAP